MRCVRETWTKISFELIKEMSFTRLVILIGLVLSHCQLSYSTATQDFTLGKACSGASEDDSKSGTDLDHYNDLKEMYTNCTYVLRNIEIHPMPSLGPEYTLDFLSSIVEVSGYVRVQGELPQGVKKLPFSKLTIIRGEMLTKHSDTQPKEFSLYVYNVRTLTSIGLTALREISRGHAYIGYNGHNCFGEQVNWADIFQNKDTQRANITLGNPELCMSNPVTCSDSCESGHCWGPGPGDCQSLNKEICADQCDYRCFGTQSNECCRPDCLAGCSGPENADCWGCRGFYNNGTCVSQCPRSEIYNKTTYRHEKNPDAKVSYGKLCLPSCPKGYLEYAEGCLLHTCPDGYTDRDGKCYECDGPCPRDCDWRYLKSSSPAWITHEFLTNVSNHNCTKIVGSVELLAASFDDHTRRSDGYTMSHAVTVEDLKVLSTIEEITGSLSFEPEGKIQLDSMNFLSNLHTIRGTGDTGGYSLVIYANFLTSLSLDSLKEITMGNVWLVTPNLCYIDADTIKQAWSLTDERAKSWDVGVTASCSQTGLVCDAECSTQCMGPAATQCLECLPRFPACTQKCKNYEFEGECVATCSADYLYINGTSCNRCHEQCSGGCTGPLDTDCVKCANFENGNQCVPQCPQPTYADQDKVCHPCSNICNTGDTYGCSGPDDMLGEGGCDSCDKVLISHDGRSVERCLNSTLPCEPGHFKLSSQEIDTLDKPIDRNAVQTLCIPCADQCGSCKSVAWNCLTCSDTRYEVITQEFLKGNRQQQKRCITECEKDQYLVPEDRKCVQCHQSCQKCNGTSEFDCLSCVDFKVQRNDSDGFICMTECPKHMPYAGLGKFDERVCLVSEPPSTGHLQTGGPAVDEAAIIGSVIAGVVILAGASIIAAYYCHRKKKSIEKSKEYELRLVGTGVVEPLSPTEANPDLSRLRLIKESELKKTIIIGSGAFGTVFKGFLIPEGEKVKVPVAIKVLIEGTSSEQNTELLDEARVMASVDHPCCIKIIAVCLTAQMQLITPLMPEGSLLSYIKTRAGQVGSKVLINWCAQISKGMEHLQRCGIVHRDLAARNVLVQNENQIKITDFGLAKLLDIDEEYYRADSGKVPVKWMALESIQHRIFNHQTDVWSYGVTIWEILTYGQKPYDGVKARDIALLLERGERLTQPSISTIDVYMIMIKCWMLDANTRPTFSDLTKEFTKMARDPGRYLVIDGDQLNRRPTLKINNDWFGEFKDYDEYPDKDLVAADDYLSPSTSYPRYENEDIPSQRPPSFNKNLGSGEELHSPLRYTSSPTLGGDFPTDHKLTVDTEDYLEPVSTNSQNLRPSVDDDGYLQPQSSSGYIDVLADERSNIPSVSNDSDNEEESSRQPLLNGADNSIYLHAKDCDPNQQGPTLLPNGTNPIYMSNNNGSPLRKQAPAHNYQNVGDYVNQERFNAV